LGVSRHPSSRLIRSGAFSEWRVTGAIPVIFHRNSDSVPSDPSM